MSRRLEALNISLLRTDKDKFLLHCQVIIEMNVKHYIANGMFDSHYAQDIMQSVNEELIKRLPGIEKNFDGSVRLVTYLSVVVRNICIRIHHRDYSAIETIPLSGIAGKFDADNEHRLLIEDEVQRLRTALRLFHSNRYKLLVCMKIYFRIPVTMTEFSDCFPDLKNDDRKHRLATLLTMLENDTNKELFTYLLATFSTTEREKLSWDSFRRWTEDNIRRILILLNGDPQTRTHTKETLKILLEHNSME